MKTIMGLIGLAWFIMQILCVAAKVIGIGNAVSWTWGTAFTPSFYLAAFICVWWYFGMWVKMIVHFNQIRKR